MIPTKRLLTVQEVLPFGLTLIKDGKLCIAHGLLIKMELEYLNNYLNRFVY
jgi:hypothetical protein